MAWTYREYITRCAVNVFYVESRHVREFIVCLRPLPRQKQLLYEQLMVKAVG